jgi:hypothetical protein
VTRAPDLAEPVIAFRTWRALEGALLSPYLPQRWDAGVAVARCEHGEAGLFRHTDALLREEHTSPDPRCRCGIHAYLEPRSALAGVDYRRVLGIVAVWGLVEVHPEGLRAQFAQVRALGASPAWSGWRHREVADIAAELDVPLVPEESLPASAIEFGSPLPVQLRRPARA